MEGGGLYVLSHLNILDYDHCVFLRGLDLLRLGVSKGTTFAHLLNIGYFFCTNIWSFVLYKFEHNSQKLAALIYFVQTMNEREFESVESNVEIPFLFSHFCIGYVFLTHIDWMGISSL